MARIFNQGEEYNEANSEELPLDTPQKKPMDIKKIAIIAGGSLVLVLIIILFTTFGGKSKDKTKSTSTAVEQTIIQTYSAFDIDRLRIAGYTGDEIETNEKQGASVDSLVEVSKQKRDEALKAEYSELRAASITAASPDYKKLMANTWLGGVDRVVTKGQSEISSKGKDNANYEKLPSKGNQLFIKITLSDGRIVFMQVRPSRYADLKDSGNMIVTYDEYSYGTEKYITNLEEVAL
jgi:hypothetical protein